MIAHGRKLALPILQRQKVCLKGGATYSRLSLVPLLPERDERRTYTTLTACRHSDRNNGQKTSWGAIDSVRHLSSRGDDSNDVKNNSNTGPDKKDNLDNDRIVYYKSTDPNDNTEDKKNVEKPKSSKTGMLISLGVGASFLMGKMKFVLVGLKLTKATPLISMVLTSATYSLFFGWPYAIGMVGLIFVHECGHAIVMRYYGVPFSPMVFVPFMGAVISMKERPKNSFEEAIIAFGGPVLGSAAALVVAGAGYTTDTQILYALADWGLMINLFNLLPIGSLDGGRICSAISPSIGVLGLAGGGALIYYGTISNPIFYLIMMAGTYQTTSRFMGWEEAPEDYYKISYQNQGTLFGAYLALVAALLLAMKENNSRRKTPSQLRREAEYPHETESVPWGGNEDGVYDNFFPEAEPVTKWS